MKNILRSTFLLLLGAQALCADPVVNLKSLLREMVNRDSMARWPQPAYTCKLASSYDRHKKSPADLEGWHSNNDSSQFIRTEENQGRREWVMMDAVGPGCVVHFWSTGKTTDGIVRIYLDGNKVPVITAELQTLLYGKSFVRHPLAPHTLAVENPRNAGNLYLPIPYASHCKITFEETDPKKPMDPPKTRYYNIEYRTYADGTKVKSFSLDDLKESEQLLAKTEAILLSGAEPAIDGKHTLLDSSIEPGKETFLELPPGPTAVRSLKMLIDGTDPQDLRSLVLIGHFDDEETIWCPVGDFFGSGVGLNALESWNRRVTKDGSMTCRWVMPYRKTARFSLLNLGQKTIKAKFTAISSPWTWDERSMYFHVNWRQQDKLPTRPKSDWNYITVTGKGVFVGDGLCIFNPEKKWWGEGDEEIWIDGESFPSHRGTGSEDYYCYAWSDSRLFNEPFANHIRSDGPEAAGQTVVTRTRGLDAIPFTKSLQFDMEVWHWADCLVCYAATTYWYALPGATSNRGPLPEEASRPIPLPSPSPTVGH